MRRIGRLKPVFFAVLFLVLAVSAVKIIIQNYINKTAIAAPPSDKYVKSLDMSNVTDGTAPFENNDLPGNDSSSTNKIVRANDKLVYEVRPFMETIPGHIGNVTSVIHFEATLPKQRLIFWDLETIKAGWGKDAVVTEYADKYVLTASYDFNSEENSAASTSFPFHVLVSGAKNATEIKPSFRAWMEGNTNDMICSAVAPTVKVSSEPRYQVELVSNGATNDYKIIGGVTGRVRTFAILYKMVNPADKVGLRGIEYPAGDFMGNLEFKVTKTNHDTHTVEDVTARMTPSLYNYKINSRNVNDGQIPANNNTLPFEYALGLPVKAPADCANGVTCVIEAPGSFQANQAPGVNLISTRLLGYNINQNTKFPNGGFGIATPLYNDRTGFISLSTVFVFSPLADGTGNYQLDLEAKLKNIQFADLDGALHSLPDQSAHAQFNAYPGGNFSNAIELRDQNMNVITSDGEVFGGKNVALPGQGIIIRAGGYVGPDNDPEFYGARYASVVKVDADAIEFTGNNNQLATTPRGSSIGYQTGYQENLVDPSTYQVLYGVKGDGTNWASDQQMIQASAQNLAWFTDLATAKQRGAVVAIAIESTNNAFPTILNGSFAWASYGAKVKDGAATGKVYQFQHESYFWKPGQNQSSILLANSGSFVMPAFPVSGSTVLRHNYIKTAYDANGVQVPGTHFGGKEEGNSLLVVSAKPSQTIEVEMRAGKNDSNKAIFDLGANETLANFKITPKLEISGQLESNQTLTNPTFSVSVPAGLEVVPDSYTLGGTWNPDTQKVDGGTQINGTLIKNPDGSSTLRFTLSNVPLTREAYSNSIIRFRTRIPINTPNAKSFPLPTVITVPELAQTPIETRSSTDSILVSNLIAQATVKRIEQPIIELGENFDYQLVYFNNTDVALNNVSILDILPFNGDGNGSDFAGEYTISNIRSNLNAPVYCTTDQAIRSYNANNFQGAPNITWRLCGNTELSNVTAIYSTFNLGGSATHEVTYKLKPTNPKPGGFYVSNLKTHIASQADTLNTPYVVGTIAYRSISGIAWFDNNADGLRQDDETTRLANREVRLTTHDGSPVRRIDGTEISPVMTDENGFYEFTDVPPLADLQVHFHLDNDDVVTLQVFDHPEINNDADENGIVRGLGLPNARAILLQNANPIREHVDLGLKRMTLPKVPGTGVGKSGLILPIIVTALIGLGIGAIIKLKMRRRWY